MKKQGILTIVSGFAGSGKGTIMKNLLSRYKNYALSVSATTRSPRPGERDGIEYFFKTKEVFEKMIEEGAFLEHACYVGNYYGTPSEYVDEQLENGKDVILEIEIQGALQVKKMRPDTLLVFVTPPSAEELEKRLRGRGTETEEVIIERIRRAALEAKEMSSYDYVLVNDKADEATERLHRIIQSQHFTAERQESLIDSLREGLSGLYPEELA